MREENKNKDLELNIVDLNHFGEPEDEIDFEELCLEEKKPVESDEDGKKDEPRNIKKEILSWVITFAAAFVLAFVLKNYVIINASVPTGSMENVIQPKDQLLGSRLAYLKEGPERGDIIFFYFPDDESQKFVKRVIGLPGEKVTIIEGKVYINDSKTPLDEPYLKEEWVVKTGPYEFYVPEDSYFCMGDNRNHSHDARDWVNTYVSRDKIIGKALYIYLPFDHMGPLE